MIKVGVPIVMIGFLGLEELSTEVTVNFSCFMFDFLRMNRLLRSGGAGRLLARRNQEVRGGGGSALGPVLLVVGGVGAYWLYNNRTDVKQEAQAAQLSFKKRQENREDWEKYLPISAKHSTFVYLLLVVIKMMIQAIISL